MDNRIDEILQEQKAKGGNYATWQKERYPVKATRPFSSPDLSRSQYRRNAEQLGKGGENEIA